MKLPCIDTSYATPTEHMSFPFVAPTNPATNVPCLQLYSDVKYNLDALSNVVGVNVWLNQNGLTSIDLCGLMYIYQI